jgi:RNA polymerase sigma-70 factor (ECF subfamily)
LIPEPETTAAAEEASLLALVGAGDREAFRELYRRYSRPLFSLAIRIMGDTGDAEEQTQDAFIKIWRNAASFDPRRSRPFTWAVTITRRTCIDRLRKRRRQVATAPLPGDGDASLPGMAGPCGSDIAEARDDSARLMGALADIPSDQRNALELAIFSAMTHPEIAQRLRQPVGTVKSWIRRGLLALRATLAETNR